MRVSELLVFSALILMTLCEELEDKNESRNLLIKRNASNELDAHLRYIKTHPKNTAAVPLIVRPLNVRSVVPPNQVRVLTPINTHTNININNVAPKQPLLTVNKVIDPAESNNANVDNKTNKLHDDKNNGVIRHRHHQKEHGPLKLPIKEVNMENSDVHNINIIEKDTHKSRKPDENPLLNEKSSSKLSNVIDSDSSPDKASVENTLTNSVHEPGNKIKQEHENNSINNNGSSNHVLASPKEPTKDILENQIESPLPGKSIIATKNNHINEDAFSTHENPVSNSKVLTDNINNEKNESLFVPLQVDKSLKLEGGEEIVIQNNNYEELFEKNSSPQYDNTPTLINSELRSPQPFNSNQLPIFNTNNGNNKLYLNDDKIKKYNQYLNNAYDGYRNEYDTNKGYQLNQGINYKQQCPIGQWRNYYQDPEYNRVWRTWRNNQIFIRPKQASNDLFGNNWYGLKPNKLIPSVSSPSFMSPNLYGDQNIAYSYSQPSCSCNLYGY